MTSNVMRNGKTSVANTISLVKRAEVYYIRKGIDYGHPVCDIAIKDARDLDPLQTQSFPYSILGDDSGERQFGVFLLWLDS